jgi:hypothetical protein
MNGQFYASTGFDRYITVFPKAGVLDVDRFKIYGFSFFLFKTVLG